MAEQSKVRGILELRRNNYAQEQKNKSSLWYCNSHIKVHLLSSRYWKVNVSYYITVSYETRECI
jgi:HEPN domain-containing protein